MRLWKKRKQKITVEQVSLPVLIRQVIYDSMLTPPEGIADAMGLPPISDEVAEMEERASQERLSSMSALLPFIDAHADIAAKIAAAAYLLDDTDEDEDGDMSLEQLKSMTSLFRLVSLAASVSCVSTLVNLGLVDSKVVSKDE